MDWRENSWKFGHYKNEERKTFSWNRKTSKSSLNRQCQNIYLKNFRKESRSNLLAIKIIQTVESSHGVPQCLAGRTGHATWTRDGSQVFPGTSTTGMFNPLVVVHYFVMRGISGGSVRVFQGVTIIYQSFPTHWHTAQLHQVMKGYRVEESQTNWPMLNPERWTPVRIKDRNN